MQDAPLSRTDYAAMLAALDQVSAASDLAEFASRCCEALAGLLPAVSISYNELDIGLTRAWAAIHPDPGAEWFARYQGFFEAHMAENPLVTAMRADPDLPPTDWLEIDPERSFERTPLYLGFYVPNGIGSQLAFTVPSDPGIVVAIAVNRDGAGFTDRERALAAALRPVLGNAYRLVRRLSGIDLLRPAEGADSPAPRIVDPGDLASLGLSPRQAEIAALVATGATNRQIATAAGISPETVRKHLENIYRTLGVTNRVAAAVAVLDATAA